MFIFSILNKYILSSSILSISLSPQYQYLLNINIFSISISVQYQYVFNINISSPLHSSPLLEVKVLAYSFAILCRLKWCTHILVLGYLYSLVVYLPNYQNRMIFVLFTTLLSPTVSCLTSSITCFVISSFPLPTKCCHDLVWYNEMVTSNEMM